jgi:hypothetical protein
VKYRPRRAGAAARRGPAARPAAPLTARISRRYTCPRLHL